MKNPGDSGIPEFQSLEEEKVYWEARGPLAEGHKGKVSRPRPGQKRSSFLAVRLTGEEITRLRDVAEKQGMGPSTFARMVISEAIVQRSAAPKSRTLDEVMQALEESLPQEIRQRMEALLGAIAVGDPPILLELTDTKKLEELTRLLVATFLSVAGVQVISPDVERHKGVRRVAETRTYKAG